MDHLDRIVFDIDYFRRNKYTVNDDWKQHLCPLISAIIDWTEATKCLVPLLLSCLHDVELQVPQSARRAAPKWSHPWVLIYISYTYTKKGWEKIWQAPFWKSTKMNTSLHRAKKWHSLWWNKAAKWKPFHWWVYQWVFVLHISAFPQRICAILIVRRTVLTVLGSVFCPCLADNFRFVWIQMLQILLGKKTFLSIAICVNKKTSE